MTTIYEQYSAERAHHEAFLDAFAQPLDVAVMKVDTRRPTRGGLLALRMPKVAGDTRQNLAALQERAAAIRAQIALARQPKDRGS